MCEEVMDAAIHIPTREIGEFCRRHHIRKLSLFGSVLRSNFTGSSDVDVLVTFAPGHVPGLQLIDMEDELSILLGGRRVDLVTDKFINRRIRDAVLDSASVVYEE